MDVELVRFYDALHNIFSEPVRSSHENHVSKPGFGVERENHTAGRTIRTNHLHDADRQRHLEMIEPVIDTIGYGPVGEQRSKAASASDHQVARAANVEETLMLSGKARRRQVLGRRGTADGDRNVGAVFLFQLFIGLRHLAPQFVAIGRRIDDSACRGCSFGEIGNALLVQSREQVA